VYVKSKLFAGKVKFFAFPSKKERFLYSFNEFNFSLQNAIPVDEISVPVNLTSGKSFAKGKILRPLPQPTSRTDLIDLFLI